jgi:hypothetical protein
MLLATPTKLKRHAPASGPGPAGVASRSLKRPKRNFNSKPPNKPRAQTVSRRAAGAPAASLSLDDDDHDAIKVLLALPNAAVYRPRAHLHGHPSDVKLVSGDKLQGFELHTFVLEARSPVLGAMLSGGGAVASLTQPVALPEGGAVLRHRRTVGLAPTQTVGEGGAPPRSNCNPADRAQGVPVGAHVWSVPHQEPTTPTLRGEQDAPQPDQVWSPRRTRVPTSMSPCRFSSAERSAIRSRSWSSGALDGPEPPHTASCS